MFSALTKAFLLAFSLTCNCSCEVFETLFFNNLAWGLPTHTSFDELDSVLKSQVPQNHKLQIDF